MLPAPFEVSRVRRETSDVITLELQGTSELHFEPGQFNMLYAFGVGEAAISISGDPANPGKLVHTIRAVGAVTDALCSVKRGHTIGVRGPYGSAWPLVEAEGNDVIFLAGGIGLAPLRGAVHQVLAKRTDYGRVFLLYGTRAPEDILFRKELETLRGRFDMEVEVTVDSAQPSWRGNVGTVTTLIPRTNFDPDNTTAFICGPEIMMQFTVQALLGKGVPKEQLYISTERNMKCAVGFCGHCQLGPKFICKDGPVFGYPDIAALLGVDEL
jgi:NAD(P)H-flavin reductase